MVLTDDSSCYRSRLFGEVLGDSKHRRTRAYRPQTNGKVERFNRTMLEEWAYVRPYLSEAERVEAFSHFLHLYNHHRSHTALGGQSLMSRVNDPAGHNISRPVSRPPERHGGPEEDSLRSSPRYRCSGGNLASMPWLSAMEETGTAAARYEKYG